MQDNAFFWSPDPALLAGLRAAAPEALLMVRRMDHESLEAALASLSPAIVEFAMTDDLDELHRLRGMGVRSMVFYGGADDAVFDRIIAARPHLANVDRPFQFARRLARLRPQNG
jgi:glycerophosphoryl diester phosphodiesterase